MSNELTDQEFWGALVAMPEPHPIFYRLYYNDDGTPICYSMEDLPGNYIELDQETYSRSPGNIKVVAGKLIEIILANTVTQMQPNLDNGLPCDPRDICVVVSVVDPHIKWGVQINEIS